MDNIKYYILKTLLKNSKYNFKNNLINKETLRQKIYRSNIDKNIKRKLLDLFIYLKDKNIDTDILDNKYTYDKNYLIKGDIYLNDYIVIKPEIYLNVLKIRYKKTNRKLRNLEDFITSDQLKDCILHNKTNKDLSINESHMLNRILTIKNYMQLKTLV